MANLLDKFQSKVVGAAGRITDFSPTLSSKGDYAKVQDLQVILNSWNTLLLTPKRSYTFDPEYGSDLYKLIFEPADVITIEAIKQEVNNAIMKYDDRARIAELEVQFLPNQKGFIVDIVASYKGVRGNFSTTITVT